MRILITGLIGFTGHYLCEKMKELGYEVFNLESNLCHIDDVCAEVKKVNPDVVAHLAAVSFVAHANINEMYNVNLLGTHNLLVALEKYAPQVKSILLASSGNIYGNSTVQGLINEEVNPLPANDYAVSKLSMEYMAKLWIQRLPLFIVRPFNYTGIGQDVKFVIPKIVSHFVNKKPKIELGNIHVFREFNDVRFIVDVYSKLLLKCPVGDIFNICSGRVYSLQDILTICCEVTNHKMEIEVNPDFVRKNEVEKLVGDNQKLRKLLGSWQDYTIQETLEWMLGTGSSKL
jgi:nucleoside-diphosphate-sugar epimerase